MLQTIVQKKTAPNVKMVFVWIRSVTVMMDLEDVTVKFQVCAIIYVIIYHYLGCVSLCARKAHLILIVY